MKRRDTTLTLALITAIIMGLTLSNGPAVAMGADISTITPDITFPTPNPEPVTRDTGGITQ